MLNANQRRVIYTKAKETWGVDNQIRQAIEEMAELTVALSHARRGKNDNADVVTEIADVIIMMEQLAIIFASVTHPDGVEGEKEVKLRRLARRLGIDRQVFGSA